ncbi:KTSC domain-containing protein [Rhizobium leguminosarum]|uniref:KTSC domain-containing protein n=1 Tax=Rhizobium leguminosarum TaxID=384 RepID=UPI001031CE71|nr:KTSC domain-containing protein [Rhizobium leguminosarum]TBF70353.1 KTSC domain-containing protein [Rhizobium leguminosarum]TBG49666.1 KTSC domain-containing protein [Rhizobium leguminosarum]
MAWHTYSQFESSNIKEIKYDDAISTLEITFNNGGVYQYYDVPLHVSHEFENAASKGQYLAAHIKGAYRYSKV